MLKKHAYTRSKTHNAIRSYAKQTRLVNNTGTKKKPQQRYPLKTANERHHMQYHVYCLRLHKL